MPIRSLKINAVWKKAALVIAGAACVLASWYVSKWGMANSAAGRIDDADVATYLTHLAPDDPQTHYAAAVLLEKSFDQDNIRRALNELEIATALAPENYLFWLDLGRARERDGDAEGAERALRRALELAPNYSRVQWALGNSLLRQGRIEEAFGEIKKAVASDPVAFANPAAATAWQFFDGDIAAIRRAVGDSARFDGSLAGLLAREKRFDEAMEIWRGLSPEEKKDSLRETGTTLAGKMLEGKKFRYAREALADLDDKDAGPQIGQIANGGFEGAVKPEGAGPFEWQINPGLQPQIVLSNGQKHGGNNSLLFIFNSGDGKDFRSVSQLVAVEPAASYELEIFYRSDLKTSAAFKWEVVDAADGKQIAVSDAIANRAEWSPLRVKFKSPIASDGVVVRLVREGCGQICPVAGSLWFDDVALRIER